MKTKNEPLCEGGRRVRIGLGKEGDFGKEPVKVEAGAGEGGEFDTG